MKILTGKQIREADMQTMLREPVASIDLMERASAALAAEVSSMLAASGGIFRCGTSRRVVVFAGKGNNGGDGLAVARMLSEKFCVSSVCLCRPEEMTPECRENLERLPEDYVPYWDFDAPNIPNEERDASAGAILASGLYELALYSDPKYADAADQIVASLSTPAYTAPIGANGNFILMHSVGSRPANSEVDVPLVYADYYYLEALYRHKYFKKLKKHLWDARLKPLER